MREPGAVEPRAPLARFFLDDLALKALAVALAVALFSLVHSEQDAQRAIYVDVVALLPPPRSDKLLVSEIPNQVKVTLRGSRSRVSALAREDFAPLPMDLRDTSRRHFYFDRTGIDVSGAVHIVSIEPPAVELQWAPASERRVPVRARLRGTPEEGYSVRKPVLMAPATVLVRGASDEVAKLAEVFTEDIPIDGVAPGAHDRRVQLEPLPAHVFYQDDATAMVHFEIVPEIGERVLRRLEVALVGTGEALLRPTAVSVTLRGPARMLAELEPDELVPFVDLAGLPPGVGVQPLEVRVRGVPEGFEIARIVPQSVLVRRR